MSRVLAYVPDLMDRSRLGGVEPSITYVNSPDRLPELSADFDVVVVDLSRAGVIDALRALGGSVRTVGFGSHVDRDLLNAATEAGCNEVMARSAFFGGLPQVLSEQHAT